jgi:hypothetical protein
MPVLRSWPTADTVNISRASDRTITTIRAGKD